jgi:hypothetical protein
MFAHGPATGTEQSGFAQVCIADAIGAETAFSSNDAELA